MLITAHNFFPLLIAMVVGVVAIRLVAKLLPVLLVVAIAVLVLHHAH